MLKLFKKWLRHYFSGSFYEIKGNFANGIFSKILQKLRMRELWRNRESVVKTNTSQSTRLVSPCSACPAYCMRATKNLCVFASKANLLPLGHARLSLHCAKPLVSWPDNLSHKFPLRNWLCSLKKHTVFSKSSQDEAIRHNRLGQKVY